MPEVVYFDTCIFIELLQKTVQDRFDACDALVERAKKSDLTIGTSTMTIAETYKLKDLGSLTNKEQSNLILAFFENPYISIRACDRRTAEFAHELSVSHGLTCMDAIHISTAVINRASTLYTYDGQETRKRKKMTQYSGKFGMPDKLQIVMPPDPFKGTLFEGSP